MLINILWVSVKRMGPHSFQWCPVTGQAAVGTNWSIGSSIWTRERISSLLGWRSTGTGCPEGLWSLLWRYQNPSGWYPVYPALGDLSFGRGFGLDYPQMSLPTPTILWFCDSVNLPEMGEAFFLQPFLFVTVVRAKLSWHLWVAELEQLFGHLQQCFHQGD